MSVLSLKKSPQLDNIETTVLNIIPSTYREHLDVHNFQKALAIEKLYAKIDEHDKTHFLERYKECRTVATLYRDKETKKLIMSANQCRLKWCPYCQRTRSYRVSVQVKNWLKTVTKPRFITLTLKHSSNNLESQLHHLYNAFRQFRRLKDTRKHIKGGIWFLEIKYNQSKNEYHPHIHLLAEGEYWPKEAVTKAWQKASKTSFITDIRSVYSTDKAAEYVAKYATKAIDITLQPINVQLELFRCLHGKRTMGTFGTAKVIVLTKKGTDFGITRERVCSFSTLRQLLIEGNQEALQLWECFKIKKPYFLDIGIAEFERFVDETDFDELPAFLNQFSFW